MREHADYVDEDGQARWVCPFCTTPHTSPSAREACCLESD